MLAQKGDNLIKDALVRSRVMGFGKPPPQLGLGSFLRNDGNGNF